MPHKENDFLSLFFLFKCFSLCHFIVILWKQSDGSVAPCYSEFFSDLFVLFWSQCSLLRKV